MAEVITSGEALVEIMRPGQSQPLDRPGEFSGPFASGAPAIFAVAAARLGMSTALISGVGDDAFGRLLRLRLVKEGVDTKNVRVIDGRSTGMAFIGYTAGGSREFVFHLRHSASALVDPASLERTDFSGLKWLHLSGSALALGKKARQFYRRAAAMAREAGGRLSFDPNLRPELMSLDKARKRMASFLEAADLLLPTAEEARALTGLSNDDQAARALLAGQKRIVIFKQGAAGCSVFTQKDRIDIDGFQVEEVDPTGAGDCFNAAFIFGLESGWHLEKVARFANAAGALAVTRQGPMEGAPNRSQVEAFLKQADKNHWISE